MVVQLVEGHHPRILRARRVRPGHAHVRLLLSDDRIPFLGLARNVGLPMQAAVVQLLDSLDALHKVRELLELRPLIVGHAHRYIHINILGNIRHLILLSLVVAPL